MTNHLPECRALDEMPTATRLFYSTSRKWFWEHGCICERLRACEQRVRQETFDADWSEMGQLAAVQIFRRQAYRDALDAAREAVDGLPVYDDHGALKPFKPETAVVYVMDALAAIDALRGEQ